MFVIDLDEPTYELAGLESALLMADESPSRILSRVPLDYELFRKLYEALYGASFSLLLSLVAY
jgi:hypothetical protein